MTGTQNKTYNACCHCKAIKFEFDAPPIEQALQCNCSICIRKNAIMSKIYIKPENFRWVSGKESMSVYHWGDKDVNHYFCATCGIAPLHDTIYDPGHYRINLCCVEDLDARSLDITFFDGKNEL